MHPLNDILAVGRLTPEDPVAGIPALTACSEVVYRSGDRLLPNPRASFEFFFLSRGVASWFTTGNCLMQQAGDLFIAHPDEIHLMTPAVHSETHHLRVGLRLDVLGTPGAGLTRQMRSVNTRIFQNFWEVEPLIRALVDQVGTQRPQRREVVSGLLSVFLALLGQRLHGQSAPPKAVKPIVHYSVPVQKAIVYMSGRLDARLTLREIAAAAHAPSVPQFCSQFRREVGMTPAARHMLYRLDAAHQLLRRSELNVTDVAMQFGFSSSQHFSRLFKRVFGVTPCSCKVRPAVTSPKSGVESSQSRLDPMATH